MLDIDLKKLNPPYLIHSDIFKTFHFIKNKYLMTKQDPCLLHFEFLCETFGIDHLILPSFNYDFPKTKLYDLRNTVSQVGQLTNYVLKHNLLRRTSTPIFSFLTNIEALWVDHSAPFSRGSVLDYLYETSGSIIFYGTEMDSCTYLHYVENQFGPPVFRYDKKFSGTLIDKTITRACEVQFHVRPMGLSLDYNWHFLFQLLLENHCIYRLSPHCVAVKARDVSEIWGNLFRKSPFDFLNDQCKRAVQKKIEKLGRRIQLSDCEENI